MIDQMIKVRMTNGKDIYGTNLDIGRYSVKHDCEVEHEYEHGKYVKYAKGNVIGSKK